MPKFVKWFVNLYPAQDAWVREAARENNLKGVEVIRSVVEKAMREDSGKLKVALRQMKAEAQDRALQDQIKALERRRQELKARTTQDA